MKNLLNRLLFLALCMICPALVFGQTVPVYEGAAFDQIQEVASDGMLFFGFIVAGAIIVTGFFLGRRWLRRVG